MGDTIKITKKILISMIIIVLIFPSFLRAFATSDGGFVEENVAQVQNGVPEDALNMYMESGEVETNGKEKGKTKLRTYFNNWFMDCKRCFTTSFSNSKSSKCFNGTNSR